MQTRIDTALVRLFKHLRRQIDAHKISIDRAQRRAQQAGAAAEIEHVDVALWKSLQNHLRDQLRHPILQRTEQMRVKTFGVWIEQFARHGFWKRRGCNA